MNSAANDRAVPVEQQDGSVLAPLVWVGGAAAAVGVVGSIATAGAQLYFSWLVAYMYFLSIALGALFFDGFVAGLEPQPDLSGLTVEAFLVDNLVPVTVGNILGGGVMVGAVYWLVYLRPRRGAAP